MKESNAPDISPPKPAPLEIDALIGAYDSQAEWIRFADAKAGAVLTANVALLGLLVPMFLPMFALAMASGGLAYAVLGFFFAWLAAGVYSAVRAFRCIAPYRHKGRHPADDACPHFHSVGIAKGYAVNDVDRFVKDAEALGPSGYRKQILAATLVDAHVSTTKYRHVSAAIRWLGINVVLGVLFLLAAQLVRFV